MFKKGTTLVLSVLILWLILAVATGAATILVGELRISGEVAGSVVALYAADTGIECFLYENRLVRTAECGVATSDLCRSAEFSNSALRYEKTREQKSGSLCELQAAGFFRETSRGFSVKYRE